MKNRRLFIFFASVVLIATSPLPVPAHRRTQIVVGTVVNVEKDRIYSPDYSTAGSNPVDAPLTSRYYEYRVSIQVGCNMYVGRYESPFNALPAEFTPTEKVQFRLDRHVMHFDLENEPDLRMGIVHRTSACDVER